MLRRVLCAVGLVSLLAPVAAYAQSAAAPFTDAARYDVAHRVTGTIGAKPDTVAGGSLPYPAVRNTYDAAGRLVKVEKGTLAAWQSEAVAPSAWTGFTISVMIDDQYDAMDRKVRESVSGGGAVYTVTEYSYDGAGRPRCTAVRMNPAAFATPLADTCVPGPEGSAGPDRIEKIIYTANGDVAQVRRAVGTPLEQVYASYSYTANGKVATTTDANGNVASMTYDGLDRQTRWSFPSPTYIGSVNTADYEQYGYDANGNRTSLRRRDGRVLTFGYDALNRVTSKVVPDGCAPIQVGACAPASATRDVYYGYDLAGHQTYARFDSATGEGIANSYDGFGQLASTTSTMGGTSRTLSYQYDADGARTRVTWPDGNYLNYRRYDNDRLYYTDNDVLPFFHTPLDSLGRVAATYRWGLSANTWSFWTGYGYDSISRLNVVGNAFATTAYNGNITLGFSPASQIVSRARDNDAFAFNGYVNVNRSYAVNGLNQYSTAGPATFGYDANGNLIGDGTTSYTFDAENRLISASNGAQLVYDPLGRLFQTSGGAAGTTRLLYDGDQLVGEYDTAGTMLRRYFHGDADDDPQVMFAGAQVTNPNYLFADQQGSIVAITDANGNVTNVNSYDEYGIPAATNQGRFQYTGQAWIAELGMYYYKARFYSPTLGRFMQTDPIGYKDQINLYAYVANDPVNGRDPTGLATCQRSVGRADCDNIMTVQNAALRDIKTVQAGLKSLASERAAISVGGRKNLSREAQFWEHALNRHFGSSSNAIIGKIEGQLAEVRSALEDRSGRYEYTLRDIGPNLGRTVFYSSNISLTPSFSRHSQRDQEVTILHEPRHSFGANTFTTENYEGDALNNPIPFFATRNADNFALFVYNATH